MRTRSYLLASVYFVLLVFVFQALSLNVDFTGELAGNSFDAVQLGRIVSGAKAAGASPAGAEYLIIGTEDDPAYEPLKWMMERLRLPVKTAATMDAVYLVENPKCVLVAARETEALGDLARLQSYVEQGGQVVFAQAPQRVTDDDRAFFEAAGILSVGDTVTYKQAEFYQGLLVGGMVRYKDLPLTARQMELSSLCKVWATMWQGDPDAREAVVPLVYEKRLAAGVFCVVNGPFLQDLDGIGILTGVLAVGQDAFAYPVVNACTLSLLNFPTVSGDTAKLLSVYARDAVQANRALLWPDIGYILRANGMAATAFLPTDINPWDTGQSALIGYLMRALSELESELGFMTPTENRAAAAEAFPKYGFFAEYGDDTDDTAKGHVFSITGGAADFAYQPGAPVSYPAMTEGYDDSEVMNLKARGFASGMYYIHHAADMSPPLLLETPADNWQQLNQPLARLISAMVAPYSEMQRLRVSDGVLAMLRYQLVTPSVQVSAEGIAIETGLSEPSYFLLRTHKALAGAADCQVTELEEGIYLVCVQGERGTIRFGGEGG